jgi:DNA-directed RNA polymerase subunit K/omega
MNTLLADLLDQASNKYELVLKVAALAKQIKDETRNMEGTTNPVLQALQEIAAQNDGMLLVNSK